MEINRPGILGAIRREAAIAGVSLFGLSIACGIAQDKDVGRSPRLTPIPSIAGLTVIPPEGTAEPMPEKTQNMVLDGKAYIEIPMKEGLIPTGDMTIELMAKLKSSSDPYKIVGGRLFYAYIGDYKRGKEYSLLNIRVASNPFLSTETKKRLGENAKYEEINTIIAGGESDLQLSGGFTESRVYFQGNERPYSFNTDPGWKHIVLQREGGELKMFIDGKLVGTQSGHSATVSGPMAEAALSSRKGSFTVGGSINQDGPVGGFIGEIRDFSVSDVARYDGDFDPRPPAVDEHTKIFMPLNEDTNDYSGNGNNGIIVGTGVSFKPR